MINYDKELIKEQLSLEDVYQLLVEFGGNPEYSNLGIISETICHNEPGEGSKKLYFYSNSNLFHCYSGCDDPTYDIFELVRKVASIQWHQELDFNDAVRWVAYRFGIAGIQEDGEQADALEDWKIFSAYDQKREIIIGDNSQISLKPYNKTILTRLNYNIKIQPWINEGITQEVLDYTQIGYYPGGDQITIPHFDIDDNLVGLRGRTVCAEEGERYGKYRPARINKVLYNHPLGYNLYGLNWAKDNIKTFKKAVVAESEKSVLHYMSMFGIDNNICVAVCGSSLSSYQFNLLKQCGAEEIIIAFDRQFRTLGDDEFKSWVHKLKNISKKFSNDCKFSFIFDKDGLLGYKDSPLDKTKDIFLQLFKTRLDENGR